MRERSTPDPEAKATGERGDPRVDSEESLRDLVGSPSELVLSKQLDQLDRHASAFIAVSPMVILSSADADGRCDASPRGDPPGFIRTLDSRTLLIPDRKGNRRTDTMLNILSNPHLGLLFLVPGRPDTLRVNGGAEVTADAELLAGSAIGGKAPAAGVLVHVEEVYLHCARSFLRSRLWQPEEWPDISGLPSTGEILRDHSRVETSSSVVDEVVRESNADLY